MWVLCFAPLKQCALIIIMWVFHFAPLKQCALIIIMWVLLHGILKIVGLKYNPNIAYVNILNDERFNSSMWVLPKFVLVYGFIMPCMYCILGFC